MATIAAPLRSAQSQRRVAKAQFSHNKTAKGGFPGSVCENTKDEGSFNYEPIALGDLLPPATISETADGLRILVPVCGVDLRQVYVVATPRSMIVEIRVKNRIDHAGLCVTEIQDERIIRELKFATCIKERTTVVRMVGGQLEITCIKADSSDDRGWSDLIHFDTRAGLGSI